MNLIKNKEKIRLATAQGDMTIKAEKLINFVSKETHSREVGKKSKHKVAETHQTNTTKGSIKQEVTNTLSNKVAGNMTLNSKNMLQQSKECLIESEELNLASDAAIIFHAIENNLSFKATNGSIKLKATKKLTIQQDSASITIEKGKIAIKADHLILNAKQINGLGSIINTGAKGQPAAPIKPMSQINSSFMDYVDQTMLARERTISGLKHTVMHPIDTAVDMVKSVYTIVRHPKDTALKVSDWSVNFYHTSGSERYGQVIGVIGNISYGGAFTAGAASLGLGGLELTGLAVKTPYGYAYQSLSYDAIKVKTAVKKGNSLYRGGTLGRSAGPEGQFWAVESPLNSGYAQKYGIPVENMNFNFVESGSLGQGNKLITRRAPGIDSNSGGGVEVVVSPNTVKLKYMHLLEDE